MHYALAIVTSTSTPGSILIAVYYARMLDRIEQRGCLGLKRTISRMAAMVQVNSMTRLWMRIS